MNQIKKIIIEGRKVHNVGYRPFLLAKARRLRIPNYEADNVEEEGKQMVIVSVGGVEKQVQEFVEFVKENYPKKANVSGIWVDPNPPESVIPMDEYDKILAAEQQNTVIQTGLEMVGLQKQTVDKIDNLDTSLGGKIDGGFEKMDQNFNKMDTKYDKVSDKMDSIDNTLKELTKAILKLAEK